ncbi:UDP-GlcNAc--UDP-phosphate GlcNAc-1-phosphate transferase [Labilibaculum sp. A4]|uniref:MraY family glycosyltransferase n=1 Tax=Labilibaculum euxinus TaxID=2686357 RepID=UPI000F61FFDF|nr:glycosyltransferase family 4 protein [Labilibaculum euxinus]MDQ1772732.1 glycosyltransferase family 4 protein [Labilibaculum euxinus]MWN78310.1 UDP-GlcNAc--UDP-phosphate GlcNAc-1-phosphate transferase [Labilibaculum euxinus]
MSFYQIIFLTACLFIVINLYFLLADRFNIIDKPNLRSSHTSITLRGGGIIFYFGAFAFFVYSGFSYPWFFLGLTLITLISFLDDVFTLSNKLRLGIHLLAMGLLFYQLNLFELQWVWIAVALVLFIGITNAWNFMDGINGITGGYSLAVLSGLCLINNYHVTFIENDLIYCTALGLLVFNFYNFRKKAKCFAGDVGAISIAFILLFMIGKLILAEPSFVVVLLLAVYGVDSVLTIVHRLILKENIFEAHRKHVYQILANEAKVPHLIVAAGYTLVQIGINFIALYLLESDFSIVSLSLFVIGILLVLAFVYVAVKRKYFHLHQLT